MESSVIFIWKNGIETQRSAEKREGVGWEIPRFPLHCPPSRTVRVVIHYFVENPESVVYREDRFTGIGLDSSQSIG